MAKQGSHTRKYGGLLAVLTAVLAMVGLSIAQQPALAAGGEEVDAIDSITMRYDGTTISQHRSVFVDVEWSAPLETVAGDYFTLELPREFVNLDYADIHLNVTDEDDPEAEEVTVATCTVAAQLLTCTFTDLVDDLGNVSGFILLNIMANTPTDINNPGTWKVNGDPFPVEPDLPVVVPSNNGPFPVPSYLAKWGIYATGAEGTQIIKWSVLIGSEKFLVGGNPVVITDEMDPRLAFSPSAENMDITVRFADAAGWAADDFTGLTKDVDYTVTLVGTSSFVVTFLDSDLVDDAIALANADNLMMQIIYEARPLIPEQEGTYTNVITGTGDIRVEAEFEWQDVGGGASGSTAKVRLLKVDGTSGASLPDAQFELRVGADGTGPVLKSSLTTGPDGTLTIPGLTKATYSLVETTAPVGYELAAPLPFTIDDGTFDLEDLTLPLTLADPRSTGAVEWTKVDDSTDAELLADSEWLLKGPNGLSQVVVDNGISDVDEEVGQIRVDDLPWGEYELVETQAPAGYALDDAVIEFTVDRDNLSIELGPIVNEKEDNPPVPNDPGNPTKPDESVPPAKTPDKPGNGLPVTGGNALPIIGAALVVAALGAGVMRMRTIRTESR